MNHDLSAYWEECHKTGAYVSNDGGLDLWGLLNIIPYIVPGRNVLEIGVGHGRDIIELRNEGLNVYALDIAQAAIHKVADIVCDSWLVSQLSFLPDDFFDLAISNLVAQHMSTEALAEQLKYVIKALKPGGIFAMQFADLIVPAEIYNEDLNNQKVGGVCRNLTMMKQMVESCLGKIIWHKRLREFPEYGSCWYAIHISK